MKRVVAAIVLVALISNCGLRIRQKTDPQQEQKYPVERMMQVGEVIVLDAEERKQLNLFPGFDGFKEAQFTAISGGGYVLEIVTEAERFNSVNSDPNAVKILLDYIDSYKAMKYDRASFETKWGIIAYDTLGAPITKKEVERYVSPGGAASCGCSGGLIAALAAGVGLGAIVLSQTREAHEGGIDMGGGIGILFGGLALAAIVAGVVGISTGCLTTHIIHSEDQKSAVETIKEQRMPRLAE
jgi:hypothetical protein